MSLTTGLNRRLAQLAATVAALLFLAACAQTSANRADGVSSLPASSKIVLMPLDIELGLLNAGGIVEPRADWTEAARGHLNTALAELLNDTNTKLVVNDGVDPYAGLGDTGVQLIKLHGAVGKSILVHQYVPPFKLPSRPEGFDWTLGPETRRLKEQFAADYALFVFMRDSYSSSGRAAVVAIGILLGAGIQGGHQLGFASLVDLNSGQIVWFNRLFSATGDLRTPDAAKVSATALVAGFPK